MQDYAEAVAAAREESCRCPLCGAPGIAATIQMAGAAMLVIGCPCVRDFGPRVDGIFVNLDKVRHLMKEPDAAP